ncbi:MAG: AAA family ATPase [Promethearchaeota archaeon]
MESKKKKIYFISTDSQSGKTSTIIGLLLILNENGYNPGYFKPIGDPFSDIKVTKADKDVNVIHKILQRKFSRDQICPVFLSPNSFLDEINSEKVEGIKDLIKSAYEDVLEKVDMILIEGNHFYQQMYSIGLSDIELAKFLEAEAILVSKCENDNDLDKMLVAIDNIKENGLKIKGTIFSNVSELQQNKIEEIYKPILKKEQIDLLGYIPRSRLLTAPTIGEIIEATNGKLLTEDFDIVKDKIIERFIIGAMQATDALGYMRRGTNLGVITGGDRSDIIATAAEVGVSLIVLTGNLQPDIATLTKAKETNIPVILVPMDTYTTAYNIQNIRSQIQEGEVNLCKKYVSINIDWKKITE